MKFGSRINEHKVMRNIEPKHEQKSAANLIEKLSSRNQNLNAVRSTDDKQAMQQHEISHEFVHLAKQQETIDRS